MGIPGVEVESKRLVPLILGTTKPKDRSEEEIVGYRKALQWIHASAEKIDVTPNTIRKIHRLAQGGLTGDAGKWKQRDNEIVEFSAGGDRRIRFKCTSAKETPAAIEKLCENYSTNLENQSFPELLTVANFILDFLCIHPFRDGNGRVSRLLTLLCLYKSGFEVGRYVSLERIIETTKEDYYRTLADSSKGWHTSQHELFPWWSYFFGHIKAAYQELKDRMESQTGDTKTSLVRGIISEMEEIFTIADILNIQPELDREIVKKTLTQLKKENRIKLIGKGRGARWKRV